MRRQGCSALASVVKWPPLSQERRRLIGTHVDPASGLPTMVNVADKRVTQRTAEARSSIWVPPCVAAAIAQSSAALGTSREFSTKKGPVFATAVVAGTSAVKRTSDLIPFCHPLPIEGCKFDITYKPEAEDEGGVVHIACRVTTTHKTGVEMEALTGASVAALVVYDMLKGIEDAQRQGLHIGETYLCSKDGGKHGRLVTPRGTQVPSPF